MTRRRSLRVELAAALALVLMMAVVSLSLAGEVLARRRHQAQEDQRLRDHARGLALLMATTGSTDAGAERILRPSVGNLGVVAIELFAARSGGFEEVLALGLPTDLPPPQLGEVDGEGALFDVDDWVVVDRPIRVFGPARRGGPSVLRITAQRSTWATVADWREIALLALGVGVLSFVLGAGLLELHIIGPLTRVQAGVHRVAAGQLDASVPESGPREIRAFATAFNDMTARLAGRIAEIEAQRGRLAEAEQLASLGRIAAGTAHEIGNPLATVLGYVDMLLDPGAQPPLDAQQRDMLERVHGQLVRIQHIVAQLLDYSRPVGATPHPIEVLALAERIINLTSHDRRCADVELTVTGDATAVAQADPSLLEQVLQNLLVNAAKAARTGTPPARVAIAVHGDEAGVHIDVQDSGPGVPDDVRPRLFEPFFTTAAAGEGTGLGLAISRGLVARMGGSLVCLPEGARAPLDPGGPSGAVFRVTLARSSDSHNPRQTFESRGRSSATTAP